ncbi:MFS transporter [Umezawaea endophytica]|uniref:MFS transporter n=1 Tax=Umezawaea endophytica TaxID=1654476 RepID=A0A9X3A769_9PSEU|nr:MFS transporter [Umezawaea endophytica]MCS7484093.1 MFS transporter [Umezawaea endophytica]
MRQWAPLWAVCAGAAMLLFDVTIVHVALPSTGADLHASLSDLQWVVDVYALVLAALLLTSGALADRFGGRRLFTLGLGVFGAASLACALAPEPWFLITARAVQGVGAACVFATGPALLHQAYEGRARGIAFGVWGAVSGAAAAAGPLVGGVLTHQLNWRWVFLVNVPVSVLAVVLAMTAFTRSPTAADRGLDLLGTACFAAATGSVIYALIRGDRILFGVALAALVAFVLVERRHPHPVLDLRLLRSPAFTGVSLAALTLSLSAYSGLLYVSLRLRGDGLSALQTGLALAPLGVTALVVSSLFGRGLHDTSPRLPIAGGLLLVAAGTLTMTVASWQFVVVGTAVAGTGIGLVSPMLAKTAIGAVPGDRAGMATAANAACRQIGTAVGIAMLGPIFQAHGLRAAFAVCAGMALLGSALSFALLRHPHSAVPRQPVRSSP